MLCVNDQKEKNIHTIDNTYEQKILEMLLHESEAPLVDSAECDPVTLSSLGDAVITTDLECRITYLNPVAETLTGWSSTDSIGKPFTQVLTLVDEQTLRMVTSPARRALKEKWLFVTSCGFGLIKQAAHWTAKQINHSNEISFISVAPCT